MTGAHSSMDGASYSGLHDNANRAKGSWANMVERLQHLQVNSIEAVLGAYLIITQKARFSALN